MKLFFRELVILAFALASVNSASLIEETTKDSQQRLRHLKIGSDAEIQDHPHRELEDDYMSSLLTRWIGQFVGKTVNDFLMSIFSPETTKPDEVLPTESVSTDVPTIIPSAAPSALPADVPSITPSDVPSDVPSSVPSDIPSSLPSDIPSSLPSDVPSSVPSDIPSSGPSDIPSTAPSDIPSSHDSDFPSISK